MRIEADLDSEIKASLAYGPLRELIDEAGRACSISYPAVAARQADELLAVVDEYGIEAKMFGAHKATNSIALISATRRPQFGCDVASSAELASAFKAGFRPNEIIATGPKSNVFLGELAGYSDITIVLDSEVELQRLLAISGACNPVLLRISRSITNLPGVLKLSRFGMDEAGFLACVDMLRAQNNINLKGVAFHLDSQSLEERSYALTVGIDKILSLRQAGFDADVLDIGGGLGADYGVSYQQVQQFKEFIMNDVAAGARQATWLGGSYGLKVENGGVRGSMTGLDIPAEISGPERLSELLRTVVDGEVLADILRDNLIELWCEPGAALYCPAGAVVAEIIETRQLDNRWHVVVDIHRNQLCFDGSEALPDPILLTCAKSQTQGDYLLAGNLCAETDVLHQRFISLPYHPQPGDLLVWTHTGAYRAHFSASQAIGHPLAKQYIYKNGVFDAAR